MIYRLGADGVLIAHLAFVLFVVLGALLVLRWPRLMYLHIPAVVWGGIVEFIGMICPLTPLEVRLRQLSGDAGYKGGFIEHYIVALLYPSGLTRTVQIVLGFLAVVPNVAIYSLLLLRRKRDLVQRDR
jgi:Protein of Unknown function (DUF2784)